MSDTENTMMTAADMDDDVVIYVPKKKAVSKAEYIDDEGVRVVSDRPAKRSEPVIPVREQRPAHRSEPVTDRTRRMTAFSGLEDAEPPVPVARRERGKTTKPRRRGFSAKSFKLNIAPRVLAGGIGALGILILVLAMVLSGGEKKPSLPQAATLGFVDDGGTAGASLFDGRALTVQADADVCVLSPDRRNLVVQRRDGSLLHYNSEEQTMVEICAAAQPHTAIVAVRNSGVLYTDKAGELHRFTFSDSGDFSFGKLQSYAVAKKSLSTLYPVEGKFYILHWDSASPKEAGAYSGAPKAIALSDDGRCAVWTDWSNNAQNIYLYDQSGRSILETLVGTTATTVAQFADNGKFLTVLNPDSDSAYMWNNGTVSRVKLGDTPASMKVYTINSELEQDASQEIGGIYVHVSGNAGGNVYYLDMLGDREKVISKVKSFSLSGGIACFTASDGIMYYATVNGANTSERVRISADVQSFMLSRDGQYVYYLKDVSAGLGNLYAYRIGDEEPVKIASEVYGSYVPCENGSSVIYYREPESIQAKGSYIGVMHMYNYGEGSNKIASDAVIGMLSSGSSSGRISADSFSYLKYISSKDSGEIYVNCIYYRGGESTAVLKDVYYDSDSKWKLK